jgi:hypothetical protein
MARPVDIREESGISTFRLWVPPSGVLCVAIVLVRLEIGRDMVRRIRVAENVRGFIQIDLNPNTPQSSGAHRRAAAIYSAA